jgi:hypothetical protein
MLRKVLWFFVFAFLLYFVVSSPSAATDAITSIAGGIGTVFQNVAAALDGLFDGGDGAGGAIYDPPRAPATQPDVGVSPYDRPMGDIPKPSPPADIPSGVK